MALIPDAERHLAEVRAIPDVRERVRAANAAIAEVAEFSTAMAAITRETVQQLRAEGDSLAQVAAKLGVSRGRAQQLAAPKKTTSPAV